MAEQVSRDGRAEVRGKKKRRMGAGADFRDPDSVAGHEGELIPVKAGIGEKEGVCLCACTHLLPHCVHPPASVSLSYLSSCPSENKQEMILST